MPSKYQEYRQMADTAERQLTSSYKIWTQFLRTAARLYKYPYNEQVMIHAQRPDATACAEYDFWNKKMGRFVRRGSTGIALIDTSGQKPQLRYVFDVADTGEREHSRPLHLWQFRAEHEDAVAAVLERSYDVSGSNGLVEQMESAAAQLAKEYWAGYVNLENDKYEKIELLGKTALFSNDRLTDADIPEGLCCCHLRHSDDSASFCAVEPRDGVNRGGSVILKEPLEFGESGYIPLDKEIPLLFGRGVSS